MIGLDLVALEAALPGLIFASIRPGAALLAAPVFGGVQTPVQLRFIVALAIGLAGHDVPASFEALSGAQGMIGIAREAVVGLALGFGLQLGFAAASVAGEAIGNAMGLGFASLVDPLNGHGSPIAGQALSMLAMMIFLGMDGHLAFFRLIVEAAPPDLFGAAHGLALMGGGVLQSGMTIALPVVAGVLVAQLALALVARAAPALNLFAIGLPAALLAGLLLFAASLPAMSIAIARAVEAGLGLATVIAR